MAFYRKIPVTIQAHQWFKNGDHPEDFSDRKRPTRDSVEGLVVRYFSHPVVAGSGHCSQCGQKMSKHGWIDTPKGGHRVCPGDFIITDVEGEMYPCKPDIFEKTYEEV